MTTAPARPRWRVSAASSAARSRAIAAALPLVPAAASSVRSRATSACDCRSASRTLASSVSSRVRSRCDSAPRLSARASSRATSRASRALCRCSTANAASTTTSSPISSFVLRFRRATSAAIRKAVLERRGGGAAIAAYCSRGELARSADARTPSGTVSTAGSPGRMRNSTAGPFCPRPITSPSASTTSPEMGAPFTNVPFVLPRSRSTKVSLWRTIPAWREDTSRSRSASQRTSESGCRPRPMYALRNVSTCPTRAPERKVN